MRPTRRRSTLPAALLALAGVLGLVIVAYQVNLAEPRPAPTRSGDSALLLSDDFSSGSGWASVSSETAGISYTEGGYRLHLARPADDGLSVQLVGGKPRPSIAASAVVAEHGDLGGLVGVGCAEAEQRVYLGAVEPAGSGFVILRIEEAGSRLLQYGADAEGAVRGGGEENELEIQCRASIPSGRTTSVRLFSNGRLLADYDDRDGLGPFRGMAVGGISLRRSLDAVFSSVALRSLPLAPRTPARAACDALVSAERLEAEYAWLVDSGAIRKDTVDFDAHHVARLADELSELSTRMEAAGRGIGPGEKEASLLALSKALTEQRVALSGGDARADAPPVDVAPAASALSCGTARPSPRSAGTVSARPPSGTKAAHRLSSTREFDRALIGDLPAPSFVPDPRLPAEPHIGVPDSPVEVDFQYDTFRVFGSSIEEINESLRVQRIKVGEDVVSAATYYELQPFYARNPLSSGCALYPNVTLSLLIILPEWKPPPDASRYVISQWNQYVWDLDSHERHHASLWIQAANAMVVAITGAPPQPTCQATEAIGKARLAQVVKRYTRLNRRFDQDVAAGRRPVPSLP